MSWLEKSEQAPAGRPDEARSMLLDKVKNETLPVVKKEAEDGSPGFKPMKFQPVKSPGIYEAEFAVKNDDLIFHFWPHGYHEAERNNRPKPRFQTGFLAAVTKVMAEKFGSHRVEVSEDKDMGSVFVKANGWGANQYQREHAIKVCESVHKAMGGTEG